MVVWVQFPGFPVHFYHKELLFTLGNMIGRAIKLDFHTANQQRAKFARMAVEVDLSKPLVPRIRLDGKWQKVEFGNLPIVCFECGKIGHTKLNCPSLSQALTVASQSGAPSPPLVAAAVASPEDPAGFGPWMLVSRKSRRNSRDPPKQGKLEPILGNHNGKERGNSGKEEAVAKMEKVGAAPLLSGRNQGKSLNVQDSNLGKQKGKVADKGKERKGKEIVDMEVNGILGPAPKPLVIGQPKPTINSKNKEASSSKQTPRPAEEAQPNEKNQRQELNVSSNGNGVKIQIVEVKPYELPPPRTIDHSVPSAVSRTKQKKEKKKSQGSKTSTPMKLTPLRHNPMKALQFWSPVKDKKNKSKERRVALTLQQISEWTGKTQSEEGKKGDAMAGGFVRDAAAGNLEEGVLPSAISR
ncbi:unnamed protein product [Linum tenue]|uniref:CCHC-type domain-containing protein n=1 Tax=Linum tenue TaxID=586396 RepID=A0AAV0R877_9ROSI|nr:unnamed protein product [Linum tenue]